MANFLFKALIVPKSIRNTRVVVGDKNQPSLEYCYYFASYSNPNKKYKMHPPPENKKIQPALKGTA